MLLSDDISSLKGIGVKTSALFNRVGVFSLWDLIMYVPRGFEEFPPIKMVSDIKPGEEAAMLLTVKTEPKVIHVKRLSILSVTAHDAKGAPVILKWFNSPFLKNLIFPGMTKVFFGKIVVNRTAFELEQPKFFDRAEYEEMTGVLQPVYRLTRGLSSKTISSAVKQVISNIKIEDFLSDENLKKLDLMSFQDAVGALHCPKNREETIRARKRAAFNEFLLFMLKIRAMKEERAEADNGFKMIETAGAVRVMESLPYALTSAQNKAYKEIMEDLSSDHVMNRLLQGDTGSGKTIIAFLAMITAAENGYQAAMMAPTEVLASQHFKKLKDLIESAGLPIKAVLLTGALPAKEKREVRAEIEDGSAALVIGTHALIEESVIFKDLSLAITDEQHRFGVRQRERLSKDKEPHVLVMSATPIPRTLAIMLYGDLDISLINEMPGNRLPIKNCLVGTEYRNTAYNFILKEIKDGHQAYVICPLVESSEAVDNENVTDYAEKLKGIFGSRVRVGMLNGRMKSREKNAVMESFASHEIDILVSTTVVEVGVDVPNATVMMIENAERFGLASLHQIRGRVGRGGNQGYCIFIDTSGKGDKNDRLRILRDNNDGFKIADEDLALRGPGDLFGIRQSGDMDFRIADIYNDADMLRIASDYINDIDDETVERVMKYEKIGDRISI